MAFSNSFKERLTHLKHCNVLHLIYSLSPASLKYQIVSGTEKREGERKRKGKKEKERAHNGRHIPRLGSLMS